MKEIILFNEKLDQIPVNQNLIDGHNESSYYVLKDRLKRELRFVYAKEFIAYEDKDGEFYGCELQIKVYKNKEIVPDFSKYDSILYVNANRMDLALTFMYRIGNKYIFSID